MNQVPTDETMMSAETTVPEISVITIVKNNEKLLPRAIESVLAQSFSNFEFIIVNDGSTDDTRNVIGHYEKNDQRIIPIHFEINKGRAEARNTGLFSALGDYLLFLDADDYLPKSSLEKLIRTAKCHDADIVYGSLKCFDKHSQKWLQKHYTNDIINAERHGICIEDHVALVNNHAIIGRLYNNKFLKANNISFNTSRRNGEDILFAFYTAYHANRISLSPSICAYYYCIGNYLETANESKLFDARDNVLETIQFSLKHGKPKLQTEMLRKGAEFVGNLDRAAHVYRADPERITAYLKTLMPFVENLPEAVFEKLPEYHRHFINTLRSGKHERALEVYLENKSSLKSFNTAKKNNQDTQKENSSDEFGSDGKEDIQSKIDILRRENFLLATKLDAIYQSRSWKTTHILRKTARVLRGWLHVF